MFPTLKALLPTDTKDPEKSEVSTKLSGSPCGWNESKQEVPAAWQMYWNKRLCQSITEQSFAEGDRPSKAEIGDQNPGIVRAIWRAMVSPPGCPWHPEGISNNKEKRTALLLMSPCLWIPECSQVVQVTILDCGLFQTGTPFLFSTAESKTKAKIGECDNGLLDLLCGKAVWEEEEKGSWRINGVLQAQSRLRTISALLWTGWTISVFPCQLTSSRGQDGTVLVSSDYRG